MQDAESQMEIDKVNALVQDILTWKILTDVEKERVVYSPNPIPP